MQFAQSLSQPASPGGEGHRNKVATMVYIWNSQNFLGCANALCDCYKSVHNFFDRF